MQSMTSSTVCPLYSKTDRLVEFSRELGFDRQPGGRMTDSDISEAEELIVREFILLLAFFYSL